LDVHGEISSQEKCAGCIRRGEVRWCNGMAYILLLPFVNLTFLVCHSPICQNTNDTVRHLPPSHIIEQQLIWSNLVQKGFYVHLSISEAPLKEPTPGNCTCRELMPPRPSQNNFAHVQSVFEVMRLTFVGLVGISRFGGGAPTRRVVGNCYLIVGQCLNILDKNRHYLSGR
jgi:hypothetical protein